MLPTRRQLEDALLSIDISGDCWDVQPEKKKRSTLRCQDKVLSVARFFLQLTSEGDEGRVHFKDSDKICGNAICVRPTHFRAGLKDLCYYGHPQTEETRRLGTRKNKKTGKIYGRFECKICATDRVRKSRNKQR